MRIVVTGGAGFIGSSVCGALVRRGDEVVCIDNFNDYYVTSSPDGRRFASRKMNNIASLRDDPSFHLQTRDITDRLAMEATWPRAVDAVVHLAARAGVRASFDDVSIYEQTNVSGTSDVLEIAFAHSVRRFIIASSSSVYGTNEKVPFSEDDPTERTISPYAITKKRMEQDCRAFHDAHPETRMTLLRFFTVYGPRGRTDMAPYRIVDRCSRGAPFERNGDGTILRDFTHVSDIVDGLMRAIDTPFPFETINLGNNQPIALNQFIAIAELIVGAKLRIEQKNAQQGDVPITYADISKAQRLLGWQPATTIEQGIANLVEWYNRNPEP
ncbi:NAD-dependent epimerase/dehydratase family protein [Candidatus Woesearchaeota archaeon]|nr:NAD-dependent epimerase/dehydratase family protein [Candidatus Woesearchaeota archaeon]